MPSSTTRSEATNRDCGPEMENLIITHTWKWFWRFSSLAVLIVGMVSALFIYAGKIAIHSLADQFKAEGAAQVAEDLSKNKDFTRAVADKALPIGTILIWYGERTKIPTGWASCDGTLPESNLSKATPNFCGRVLVGMKTVGMKTDDMPQIVDAEAIKVHKPAWELKPGGGAGVNEGLGDGGIHVHFDNVDSKEPFLERVQQRIPAEDLTTTLTANNLPRAEVFYIIRYK